MTTTLTCDHCGQPIGTVLEPRGRTELGDRGKSLKERAQRAQAEAETLGFLGRSYDLHRKCYETAVLPHLVAAGLDT